MASSPRTAAALLAGVSGAAALAYYLTRRAARPPSPQVLHLTLIGFGAVNKALARLIASDAEFLLSQHNLIIVYRAVVARHGMWEAQPGHELDAHTVAALADAVAAGTMRLDGKAHSPPVGVAATPTPSVAQIRALIKRTPKGTLTGLAEAIDVSYADGEPAATYIADALRCGSHVTSANKGPVVNHRAALLDLARRHGVRYLHESAVMDGVPIFSAWRGGFLPGGARLTQFRGCLNSTSGVVLSGMEQGQSMEVALRTAQDAGIAEADPSGDLRGFDAAVKLVALSIAFELGGSQCEGEKRPPLRMCDVDISGIENVTTEQAMAAKARGNKLRLVASAELVPAPDDEGRAADTTAPPAWMPLSRRKRTPKPPPQIRAFVRMEELTPADPLFGLEGADSAVMLMTDRLAPVTISQKGSEVTDTAFGEYADLLRAVRPLEV